MGIPSFRFPTSTKAATKAQRLQADLVDRADGSDDVREKGALDRDFAKDLWQRGQTAGAKALADAAQGRGPTFEVAGSRASSPQFVGNAPKKVGWQDLTAALKNAEAGGQLDAQTLTAAMAGLGFVREVEVEAKTGCLVFERDQRSVGVRLSAFGAIHVAEIAVEESDKGGKSLSDMRAGEARTYVAGTLIEPELWDEVTDEFVETLQLAQRALEGVEGDDAPELPVAFAAFKRFIKTGADAASKAEDAAEAAELKGVQQQIRAQWTQMVKAGTAPKGVMLQFDGPDGAGKTSSSKYIAAALMAANDDLPAAQQWSQSTEVFKAPTDEDKAWMANGEGADTGVAKWQWRHVMRGIPEARELLIKDRFQPGDYVYVGEHDPQRLQSMASEFETYEQHVQDQGVMSFKAILWADEKKQAKTFGKRMARGAFSDALLAEIERRGTATDEIRSTLSDIKHKVEGADMRALTTLRPTLERYQAFADAAGGVTPFPVIEATDRHAARLELLNRFLSALKAHEASASR